MRTQTLDKHNNFSKNCKGSHVKGHLNGLLFVLTTDEIRSYPEYLEFIESIRLKVKYVEDKVRTLVPSIPIQNFIDITNLKYGSTNEVGMLQNYADTALLAALNESGTLSDSDTFTIFKDFMNVQSSQSGLKQIQFYVDLGSIFVDNGNELHYELHGDVINSLMDVTVYAISKESEPMHFLEYDTDSDRNEMHQNVVQSYLCSPKGATVFKEIELNIDSTSVQYESNTKGLLATTALFSKVENVSVGRTLPVFESLNGTPEDVQIKFMSDADITGYYILNVRINSTFKGYFDGRRKTIEEKARVIQKLEIKQPELAQVLQLEGMPTATELKESVL